jgi:putative SOS response-associated peptidase YedK
MCGRYAFYSPAESVKRIFRLEAVPELEPRYNIAPTHDVPAVRLGQGGHREFAMLRWGLVPRWAKSRSIGNRMINARAETVAEKSAYRDAFKRRRCLVLANGWYEWQAAPGGKQPWFIRRKDGRQFAFAGLWETFQDPAGEDLESCTIVTTDAAESIRAIHDRMPVVLDEDGWERWLDPVSDAQALLTPYPGDLEAWRVSTRINTPRNQGPDLIDRV